VCLSIDAAAPRVCLTAPRPQDAGPSDAARPSDASGLDAGPQVCLTLKVHYDTEQSRRVRQHLGDRGFVCSLHRNVRERHTGARHADEDQRAAHATMARQRSQRLDSCAREGRAAGRQGCQCFGERQAVELRTGQLGVGFGLEQRRAAQRLDRVCVCVTVQLLERRNRTHVVGRQRRQLALRTRECVVAVAP